MFFIMCLKMKSNMDLLQKKYWEDISSKEKKKKSREKTKTLLHHFCFEIQRQSKCLWVPLYVLCLILHVQYKSKPEEKKDSKL